jgi:hypothetical protein
VDVGLLYLIDAEFNDDDSKKFEEWPLYCLLFYTIISSIPELLIL